MQLSNLKYLILIAALGTCLGYLLIGPDPASFDFAGKKCVFPSTVGEAVKAHNMDFHSPGYYYKIDSTGMEEFFCYHSNWGDFDDEMQPKETLYPRDLHSYVFRFPEKPRTYDSLKTSLESVFEGKFVLTNGNKDLGFFDSTKNSFEYDLLTVNNKLTIGIKRSPVWSTDKTVLVEFMYNLSLGKMGTQMGSY